MAIALRILLCSDPAYQIEPKLSQKYLSGAAAVRDLNGRSFSLTDPNIRLNSYLARSLTFTF